MLDLLLNYARDHNLTVEPGFKPKDVRWAIPFDSGGRFSGDVVELGDTVNKRNRGQTFNCCPDLSQPELVAGGIKRSHFLVDSGQVVTLFGASSEDTATRSKHDFFVQLLREASTVMPTLKMVADSLADVSVVGAIQGRLKEHKAKPTDKVTLRIGDEFPLESSKWHDWWREFRKRIANEKSTKNTPNENEGSSAQMRCYATGELVIAAPTHPPIEGLAGVGRSRMGDKLIGFDKDSFQSYGLEQSANAAVSKASASAYRAALNHLIRQHGLNLAGAKVVHWFKNRVVPDEDPLPWLAEGEAPEEVARSAQRAARRLLESIGRGERPDLVNNFYYALVLSGGGGRVMVRDWMEGQFENLLANIQSWFDDLAIVDCNGQHSLKVPGIERIITSLLPDKKPSQKYEDWIKPIGSSRVQLWHAAVKGAIIPENVISRIVHLNRDFIISGQLETARKERNGLLIGRLESLFRVRMGVLKAYHLRKMIGGDPMKETMKPYLNENHPDPAYHCGRLMAILADLQHAALGDVGAGVVQRYYAAASSTPALVFGRIIRTAQFHLDKLKADKAREYDTKLGAVCSRIGDRMPQTLALEEQSLFALGYYQQIADMMSRKSYDVQKEEVHV